MNNVFEYSTDAIVEKIVEISKREIQCKGLFIIGVSGGRSTKNILEKLSALKIEFYNWRFIIVDERDVKIDSNESNARQISESLKPLLDKGLSLTNFYVGDKISLDKSKEIFDKIEHLDLAILGVGEDGHVASLFPCNLEDDMRFNGSIQVINNSPKHPAKRITVTYNFIKRIKEVFLIINGEQKHHLLAVHEGLPFNKISNLTNTKIFTDYLKG